MIGQINKVKSWKIREECTLKLAFDDEIKYELERYLDRTLYGKVSRTNERAIQLMCIHRKFIDNIKEQKSADEIAKILFDYEKNLNNLKFWK